MLYFFHIQWKFKYRCNEYLNTRGWYGSQFATFLLHHIFDNNVVILKMQIQLHLHLSLINIMFLLQWKKRVFNSLHASASSNSFHMQWDLESYKLMWKTITWLSTSSLPSATYKYYFSHFDFGDRGSEMKDNHSFQNL